MQYSSIIYLSKSDNILSGLVYNSFGTSKLLEIR